MQIFLELVVGTMVLRLGKQLVKQLGKQLVLGTYVALAYGSLETLES